MVRLVLVLVALIGACLVGGDARALDLTRNIAQFHHTGWTIRDGMPGYVNAIAQTPDGYLWIGSASGLFRFDGVRVEPFNHRLPGVSVLTLAVTESGDLWIGSRLGVSRLSRGVFTTLVVPGLTDQPVVRHIAPGRGGEVWIGTNSEVARFDGRGWTVIGSGWGSSEGHVKPGGIWGLAVARDGVVWSKNLMGLYYLRPGATRFAKADAYAGSIIDFARAPDGRLWTADVATMHFYALPDLGPAGPPPPPAQVGAAVPPGVLGHVLFDREGALWCANGVTGGLYRVRGVAGPEAHTEPFVSANGLTSDLPGSVFEDREGDIWVGTETGLDRFAPANVVTDPTVSIRTQGADIAATANEVYVADGWATPLANAPHSVERLYRITDGAPEALSINLGNATSIDVAGADSVWIHDGPRLAQVRGRAALAATLPSEAKGAEVEAAVEDGNDLWIALNERGVFRRRGAVWSHISTPGITANPDIRIRVDGQGGIWIFDLGAELIDRFVGDRVTTWGPANGHRLGLLSTFTADRLGVLLGGQLGVSRFDGRSFHTLTEEQAPFLVETRGIVLDQAGGVWFHTTTGIYRVSASQLEQAFHDPRVHLDFQQFDARDGLRSTATHQQFGGSAVRGPDGRLWFLNVDSVAWIDPQHLYRNPVPPPVSIRSLTAGERVFSGEAALKLAAGTSNLQIEYTALSLQNPDRVRFRYRLDGVDDAWIEAGPRRQAFYTRLAPGHYRFHVIAANNDGVWNTTGAALEFEIPPTFIQSGWFLLLCAILAGMALWLAYRLRVRQVAAAIQSRMEERLAERERIARELHDTLLQGFQGLILRFQAIMEGLPAGQPARRQMDAALERADEVLISGRDRVRHLRAQNTAGDLAESLTEAAEAASSGSAAKFQLIVEGAPRALHPIVAEELTAIGREAVFNAFQHARAQSIDASLTYDRHGLAMEITDDGVGIDEAILAAGQRAGHFGLLGMRERADKIEANLTVSGRAGAGAKISVFVPARVAFAGAQEQTGLWRRLRSVVDRLRLRRARQSSPR